VASVEVESYDITAAEKGCSVEKMLEIDTPRPWALAVDDILDLRRIHIELA